MSTFVPARAHKEKELILLRYLTATAFNYAICSPLIYLLVFGVIFPRNAVAQALCWFFIIFIAPVILAMVRARIVQRDSLGWLYRFTWIAFHQPDSDWVGLDIQHHRTLLCADHLDRRDGDRWIFRAPIDGLIGPGPQRHLYRKSVYCPNGRRLMARSGPLPWNARQWLADCLYRVQEVKRTMEKSDTADKSPRLPADH